MRGRAITIAATIAVACAGPAAAPALAHRRIPDTTGAIHVFNDQLADGLTDAQVRFIATHEDGTQKIAPADVDRLRRVNPDFLVLHYRLGIGDGPVPFRVGDRWTTDFATVRRHPRWFYRWHGRRVFQAQWRWYLMNPASGWTRYWIGRVLREVRLGHDDGVFADSLSVPQYLGAESFRPPLPYFRTEGWWTRQVDRFIATAARALDRLGVLFVPNAGSMITTRDRTDYAPADGVMVEGFAEGSASDFYAPGDWELQMDRTLRLVRLGRLVIGQSYLQPSDMDARAFVLASYLLVKGRHTFVNMDTGLAPEWFPEYAVDLGPAAAPPPARIAALLDPGGAYVRRYVRGWAAANPTGAPVRLDFAGTRWLVRPHGGGDVPPDGRVDGWGITAEPVTGGLTIPAHGGAILLDAPPGG